MSALTSLLVRDRVLSVSKIEEALTQQVLSGGDIETVLLELNFVPEDVLAAYRAALFGLLPATREEVMRASREALRQMPESMARSLAVIPILYEGRSLVVAAAEPLAESVIKDVRAQLGCELSVRIVTQLRLAAGLAHHFGVELDTRSRRLADVLRKREPGVIPYVRPPAPGMRPSQRPVAYQANAFDDEPESRELEGIEALEAQRGVLAAEPAAGPVVEDDEGRASGVISVELREPTHAAQASEATLADAVGEPVAHAPSADFSEGAATGVTFEESDSAATQEEILPSFLVPPEQEDSSQSPGLGTPPVPRALAGFQAERPHTIPPNAVSPQVARAVRGPISQERAEALLSEATHRDDMLFVLLRYAQQFFDFVAIFSVTRDEARGRFSHGAGLSQELMEHLVIPLSEGGFAMRAVKGQRPIVGDWSASDEERAALALLGRPAGRPGLAVPVLLGSRVVLLIYADRLGEGLSVTDAAPLMTLVPALGDALRRLIVEQKALRRDVPKFLTESSAAPAEPVSSIEGTQEQAPQGEARSDESTSTPSASDGDLTPELSYDATGDEESDTYADDALDEADGLTAVDLQAVSRLSFTERKRTNSETLQGVRGSGVSPEAREAARGRVPGVPRSAPPPPLRESLPPPGPSAPSAHGVGAYSYVSQGGAVVEENVRAGRQPAVSKREPLGRPALQSAAEVQEAAPEPATEVAPPPPADRRPEPAPEKAPARAPRLSLVSAGGPVPSMIIDMGEQVSALVDALLRGKPGDPLVEIPELVKLGESALAVLAQHFPGPLWVDFKQVGRRKVRGRDVSAVARCLTAFGDRAAPYLASKLNTGDPELCRCALLVAGEIVHPDLLDAVARRTFDANDGVRGIALEVLRGYTRLPQFDAVLRAICDLSARPGKDPRRQRIALDALSELRDVRTLRTLIARLNDPSEVIVKAAHRALVVLTGQDLGFAARKWEAWAEQAAGSHRVEWLVEALGHQDEALRSLASEELKQLTQQYFGYHPALPKKDRDIAQRKYREWWEREGRELFVRR